MTRLPGVVLFLLAGCAEPRAAGVVPSLAKSVPEPREARTQEEAPPAPRPAEGWAEALGRGDHRAAAELIDALPAERAAFPETRYARARAAVALGDFERAKRALDGLSLPLLSDEITAARAECALAAGPYAEAAAYFASRGDAESSLKTGLAFERAGDLGAAWTALERALRLVSRRKDAEAEALGIRVRAARARVASARHDGSRAAADLRFLATEAAGTEEGAAAVGALATCTPPVRLTADERLRRVRQLAERGKIADAIAELDRLDAERPPVVAEGERARARAWALYLSRTDYGRAAELFERAARLDPRQAVKDTFYAARATARAQDDARAIERYEALAHRFPASPFAEEARYQAARLRLLLGRWDEAAQAYRAYLGSFRGKKRGRFEGAVRYELGLALLAGGRGADARALFHDLAAAEADPVDRAALRELEGAALSAAGDVDGAVREFEAVIAARPLSFSALSAAARLAEIGRPVPRALSEQSAPLAPPPLDVELPEKVALLARIGLPVDAERELRRHEAEITATYAPRGQEALCEAYGKIGSGVERYRIGRVAVKGEVLDRAPTVSTRWAWDCVYPRPFDALVRGATAERGLPEGLLHSVMRQESAFRADAVSPASAVGLLQLLPTTAERVATEIGVPHAPELLVEPAHNVGLGAAYLGRVLRTFGGQVPLAAAAYNAGPRAVSRWLETGEGLPLDVWVARIPFAETRGYVARVVGNLARYAYLNGGEAAVPRLSLAIPRGLRAGEGDY